MQVWRMDTGGFYVGTFIINPNDKTELDIETPPFINNADGSITMNFIKPKWNGNSWIEGATRSEIDEWNKTSQQTPIPSQDERITALEQALLEIL